MAFEREKRTYSEHRKEWLPGHKGQLAVIHDEKLVGFFPSIEDAHEEAARRLGHQRFLIVRITSDGNGFLY
ncbi:MAG: hypothetical protein HY238_13740 [Acidobacteria bacterium]|nr:hypothetical protein [Acidobacteriota bacterium]